MFLRLRWFALGAVASFGMLAYVADQLRRVRDAMTPANLARGAARAAAEVLDATGRRLSNTDREA